MKTILYANGLTDIVETLENMILVQVPGIQVKTCNTIEGISQILRQPLNKVSVIILLAASGEELSRFHLLNTLFDNIRVILMLPDRREETLVLGFKFKTSFVSYIDSDLQDVVSVLGQILKKTKENMHNG